jgi:hypothetical protein
MIHNCLFLRQQEYSIHPFVRLRLSDDQLGSLIKMFPFMKVISHLCYCLYFLYFLEIAIQAFMSSELVLVSPHANPKISCKILVFDYFLFLFSFLLQRPYSFH